MSSDNPLSDISEGAIKGLLEWSAEKIASLVNKLKERKLAFIQDTQTIEIVKEYNIEEVSSTEKETLFFKRKLSIGF